MHNLVKRQGLAHGAGRSPNLDLGARRRDSTAVSRVVNLACLMSTCARDRLFPTPARITARVRQGFVSCNLLVLIRCLLPFHDTTTGTCKTRDDRYELAGHKLIKHSPNTDRLFSIQQRQWTRTDVPQIRLSLMEAPRGILHFDHTPTRARLRHRYLRLKTQLSNRVLLVHQHHRQDQTMIRL